VAGERTYPCLPRADVDASTAFYESLGFERTDRQVHPSPDAVVARGDIHIHLFGIDGFDPADSHGTVIVVVPDPDSLYRDFAAGLRKTHGKLPVAGIPRILRPRKKYGTVRGFSVVDPVGTGSGSPSSARARRRTRRRRPTVWLRSSTSPRASAMPTGTIARPSRRSRAA
jgi:catechol 2,3-dioxygenase-like lactoylglutathione lyase family enzyme